MTVAALIAIHSFDLAISPGVLDLGEPVFDLMLAADPVKDVFEGINVLIMIGEPDGITGEQDVEPVGTAAMRLRRKAAAAIFPALWCSSTKTNLEVRSMETKTYNWRSAV